VYESFDVASGFGRDARGLGWSGRRRSDGILDAHEQPAGKDEDLQRERRQ
jgi:hypothetical protein